MYKYQLVLLVQNINIYQTPKTRPGLSEDIAEIYLTLLCKPNRNCLNPCFIISSKNGVLAAETNYEGFG